MQNIHPCTQVKCNQCMFDVYCSNHWDKPTSVTICKHYLFVKYFVIVSLNFISLIKLVKFGTFQFIWKIMEVGVLVLDRHFKGKQQQVCSEENYCLFENLQPTFVLLSFQLIWKQHLNSYLIKFKTIPLIFNWIFQKYFIYD